MKNIYLFGLILSMLTTDLSADSKDNTALAGDIMVILLPTVTVGKLLYEKDGEGGLQFGESLLTNNAVTLTLKYTIDAERPNGENNRSFPSGHTSNAFSTATFLQMRYGWKYGVPAYTVATFVAWSRVYSEHHYTRDVLAGAVIGTVSSFIFTTAFDDSITVTPLVDNGIYGLRFSHQFSSF